MQIENTITVQPLYPSQSSVPNNANNEIKLQPIESINDLELDNDFEVLIGKTSFAEMEARSERDYKKVQATAMLLALSRSYEGAAFQKMRNEQKIAIEKYAINDREKFNEWFYGAKEEFDEAMEPYYELCRKYVEDGDLEAFLGSSLFDLYR